MRLDELRVGDNFTGFYLLRNIMMKTSKTGKPYMAASLADRTGAIDAKAWDYPGPISPADAGTYSRLGLRLTCEPQYETNKLYHK